MKEVERGSRYGLPVERKPDGTLYEMTPDQQREVAKLIQQNCCNYEKGNCIMLEDEDERVCPQRISYSVGCRWFRNAVLPLSPQLEADIFKGILLKQCVKCGTRFVPRSNRSMYCPACAAETRKEKDRERKRNQKYTFRI